MGIIEQHREKRNKPSVCYHRFLTHYKNDKDEIYLFCEGDVDFNYYGEVIERYYLNKRIVKCFTDCKNNALSIYNKIQWESFDKNRVLFFVDRDFSFWAGEPQSYDSNVYITDGYSFENDAVKKSMFLKCLEDLYGFANYSHSEKTRLAELYEKKWKEFQNGSYEIMAYALHKYMVSHEHTAKNIKINQCISFTEDKLWKDIIKEKSRNEYYCEKLLLEEPIDQAAVDNYMSSFKMDLSHYSIRGKWALAFMIELMNHVIQEGKKYAPSLYDGIQKEPKRLVELTERGAMAIIGPKINPPASSLLCFLENNLRE